MDTFNKRNFKLKTALQKLDVHDHLCLIYETQQEQFAAVIPFISIGLERKEKCVYIADDNTADAVMDAMRSEGIDVEGGIKSGALAVLSKKDSYLRNGYFDPDLMIQFLKDAVDSAKMEGFKTLRATGEMTWALGTDIGVERLIEYESKLNYLFPTADILAICQYNRSRFSPEIILDIIRTHPLVVYKEMVCRNFYYVPPDEFLNQAQTSLEVERFLINIRDRETLEETLQLSEKKYRKLHETMMDGFVYVDMNGKIEEYNESYRALLGYSPDELSQLNYIDITPEKWHAFEQKIIEEQTLIKGYSEVYEKEYRKKDGTIIPIELRTLLIKNEKGENEGMWGIVRDITERKRIEADLIMRMNHLDTITRIGNVALTSANLDTLFNEVVAMLAQALNVEYVKVLELLPDGNLLILRSGIGWKEGSVGLTISSDNTSQPGFTLLSNEPVIVEDLRTEKRFSGPPLLFEHEVVSGITIIIHGKERQFGVLGAHTKKKYLFTKEEVAFLEAVANILSEAILRMKTEEEQQKLNAELAQRIKERTIELEDRNKELERINSLFVGRELRMMELKEKIRELEAKR